MPPTFTVKTVSVEVKRGDTAKLVCEVFGAKPLTIQWRRQVIRTGKYEEINLDQLLETFTYPRYTAFEKNFDFFSSSFSSLSNPDNGNWKLDRHSYNHYSPKNHPFVNNNRTLFELHINSVNSADNGRYECYVRNDYGEDYRRLDLFVQDVPATVRNVHVNAILSRDILITWLSPEMNGNLPILQYVVQYWKEIVATASPPSHSHTNQGKQTPDSDSWSTVVSGGHRLHELEISPTETQATVKNLTPGTGYVIRVVAVNSFGRGPPSPPTRVITQEEAPNGAPIDIYTDPLSTSSLRVVWKAPPKSLWNGQLKGYYLGYRLIMTAAIMNMKPIQQNSGENQDKNQDITEKNNEITKVQQQQSSSYVYKEIPFTGSMMNNFQEQYIITGLSRASSYR